MNLQQTHKYDDIIDLPHHVSSRRPGMPTLDRAAQFASFAALTGYEAVIEETGRLTDGQTELTESRKAELNEKLFAIQQSILEQPPVVLTYFQPDARKAGGAYVSLTGRVKKIDVYEGMLVMTDGKQIPVEQIYALESKKNL